MIKAESDGNGVRVGIGGDNFLDELSAVLYATFERAKDDPVAVHTLLGIIYESIHSGLGLEGECDGEPEADDIGASEEVRFDYLS